MWDQHATVCVVLRGLVILIPLMTSSSLQAPVVFRSVPTTVRAHENTTVVLPCTVDTLGTSTVRWWRGTALLAERSETNISPVQSPLVSRITLHIDNSLEVKDLDGSDAGDYVCQITRLPPWRPIKQTHSIEVLYPPTATLIPGEDLVTVVLGEEVDVLCDVTGVPPPVVSWAKMEGEWPDEENGELVQQNARLHFVVDKKQSTGVYQCVANNDIGNPATAVMRLLVQYPPEVEAEKPWIHSSQSLRAELTCLISAEPYSQVEWVRESSVGVGSGDGEVEEEEVTQSSRVTRLVSGTRHSLLLKSVRLSDFGNYTCRARNYLGTAEARLELSGVANPAAIKTDPSMASDNSYTLIWEVDSYSQIFEYILKFKKQSSDTWLNLTIPAAEGARSTTLHSHAFNLRGLESGTIYEAELSARNSFGWNKPSIAVFSTLGPGEIQKENLPNEEEPEVEEESVTEIIAPLDSKPSSSFSKPRSAAAVQYKVSARMTAAIMCCLLYYYS